MRNSSRSEKAFAENDGHPEGRWEALKTVLSKRYESAAEVFVAFGGRVGYELSLRDLERSLRQLDANMRRTSPASALDVHGLMADAEKQYPNGLTYMAFANVIKWTTSQSRSILADNGNERYGKGRVLAGSPASALRIGRGNTLISTKIAGDDKSVVENKFAPKVIETLAEAKKVWPRPFTTETVDENAHQPTHHLHHPPASSSIGARWRPARPKSAVTPPYRANQHAAIMSSQTSAHVMKRLRLVEQKERLKGAEDKLFALLSESEAEEAEPVRTAVEKLDEKQGPRNPLPTSDSVARKNEGNISSMDGLEFQSRLASLDSVVFEQRISLADTEKNVLLRERHDLQSQLRQMEVERRQNQAAMQNEFNQHMSLLIQTFDKVGQALAHSGQKEMDAKAEKKELARRKADYDRKIREELLPLADFEGQECVSIPRISTELRTGMWDCVFSHSLESEGNVSGNSLAESIRRQMKELRPLNVSDIAKSDTWVEGQVYIQSRPTLAGEEQSRPSAFLDAAINCLEYNPVCSWYMNDCDGQPDGGSVGVLSRLDPLNDEDWVDDFLLEILIALRLNQMFRGGWIDSLRTILPIFVGGDDPVGYSQKFGAFPVDKLSLLPSYPSIQTNKAAALMLKSIGVPVPEDFLRTSVREAVCILLGMPAIKLDRYQSRKEAILDAANKIQCIVKAEWQTFRAKDQLAYATRATETAQAMPKLQESSSSESEEWDPDSDNHFKQEEDRRKKFDRTDRKIKAAQARQIANESVQGAENAKEIALSHWKISFEKLGFDSDSTDLAYTALANRGIKSMPRSEQRESQRTIQEIVDHKTAKLSFSDVQNFQKRIAKQQARQACSTWFSQKRAQLSRKIEAVEKVRLKTIKFKELSRCIEIQARLSQRAVWDAWQGLRELDVHAVTATRIDGPDTSNLAAVLQNLQAAVVEAHSKHSALLTKTNDDANFEKLLDGISVESADAMRRSGIRNIHQLKILGLDGSVLKTDVFTERGVTNKQDLLKIHAFLIDKDDIPDFEEKQQLLLQEMVELRERLEVKKEKLDAGMSRADQELLDKEESKDDKSLIVLNKLLQTLGAPSTFPIPQRHDTSLRDDVSDFDGDRLTMEYKNRLMLENGAQQAVLQMLDESLGPAFEERDKDEIDAESAKKEMMTKQEAMQAAIKSFVNVMEKAKQLLNPQDAQNDMLSKTKKAASQKLDPQFTQAELEAIRLAEDVKRRIQQAKLLEHENRVLRDNVKYAKGSRRKDTEEPGQHWASAITNPELAAKYMGYGGAGSATINFHAEGDYAGRLLKQPLSNSNQESQGLTLSYPEGPHLAWDLEPVDSSILMTRASIFQQELERRMVKGRQLLAEKISKTQEEYDVVTKQLTQLEAKISAYQRPSKQLANVRNDSANQQQGPLHPHEEMIMSLRTKQKALSEEQVRLEKEYEALDRMKELQMMDEEMEAELTAGEEQLEELKIKLHREGCPDVELKLQEAQESMNRLHGSRLIRKRLREKEMEMEILNQKMHEDEMQLKKEQDQLNSAASVNAGEIQKKLSESLRDMSDLVTQTARGRCRPEVISSLNGVQKMRRAVERHRLALESARLAEENRQTKDIAEAEASKVAGSQLKTLEELRKKERGTTETTQRELQLKQVRAEIEKQEKKLFLDLGETLNEAKSCLAGKSSYHEMTRMAAHGQITHVKSYILKANNLHSQLQSVATEAGVTHESSLKDSLTGALAQIESVQIAVKEAETKFTQAVSNSVLDMDGLLKRDVRAVQATQPADIARISSTAEHLLMQLDALDLIDDAMKVKGNSLIFLEQKFRNAFSRLSSKLDESFHQTLAKGDRSVDEAQLSLKGGKLSAAVQELHKAESMFSNVRDAKHR